MPDPRKVPLVNGEIYHVFNKGIDGRVTFLEKSDFNHALKIITYYQHALPPVRLSDYLSLTENSKKMLQERSWGKNIVTILSYCFMPNHFHLVLRQELNNGISHFMSQFLNSYTRYFNIKNKRVGQLFLDRFKNVLVTSDSQLIHLSRYVHLNPYTSSIVTRLNQLPNYNWSSLPEYINLSESNICNKDLVLNNFSDVNSYKKFVYDRADYQRHLGQLKNLIVE